MLHTLRTALPFALAVSLLPPMAALAAEKDPKRKRVLTASQLHESDYTPWEGHEVGAWPSLTMLRGKVVVEDEKFTGALSDGQWQKRKVAEEIRARPAV